MSFAIQGHSHAAQAAPTQGAGAPAAPSAGAQHGPQHGGHAAQHLGEAAHISTGHQKA